jgi:uncharacterized protein (DUF2141 family)
MRRALLLLLLAAPSAAAPGRVVLAGKILGASGQHPVHVALWDEAGFLERPVQELRLEPGTDLTFRFEVAPGRWAISAFEDRNGNGKLDMGWFGPKEPAGFWRPFHGWRKPRFGEVAAQLDRDTDDADVHLR